MLASAALIKFPEDDKSNGYGRLYNSFDTRSLSAPNHMHTNMDIRVSNRILGAPSLMDRQKYETPHAVRAMDPRT